MRWSLSTSRISSASRARAALAAAVASLRRLMYATSSWLIGREELEELDDELDEDVVPALQAADTIVAEVFATFGVFINVVGGALRFPPLPRPRPLDEACAGPTPALLAAVSNALWLSRLSFSDSSSHRIQCCPAFVI